MHHSGAFSSGLASGGHGLSRLEFEEGVHISDDAHAASGVDHRLDFVRRRDSTDEQLRQFQAIGSKVVGGLGPGGDGDFVVAPAG